MPTPTRPVSGTAVDAIWGQEVHDQAFAPAGGMYLGTAPQAVNVLHPMNAAQDPGGWLAAAGATQLVVPADGDGLYLFAVRWLAQINTTGLINFELRLGTAPRTWANQVYAPNPGQVAHFMTFIDTLAVGEQIRAAGTNPGGVTTYTLASLRLVRLGRGLGAA